MFANDKLSCSHSESQFCVAIEAVKEGTAIARPHGGPADAEVVGRSRTTDVSFTLVTGHGASLRMPAQQPTPDDESVMVPIDCLLLADSPRVRGEDPDHVRALAEVETPLPPILVHRATHRVIDGMHRLRAAELRGQSEIAVRYFDGSEADAFVQAVRSNVQHGLALSRTDREAAVIRILRSHPQWSDRAIAASTGLSAPTVGAVRRRAGLQPSDAGRVGRDGRVRPLSSVEGRQRAVRIISERPDASLREVAREAGVSVGTVSDVRERLRRGDDPVPDKFLNQDCDNAVRVRETEPVADSRAERSPDFDALLHVLRKDPSLRFSMTGRSLLQWLGVREIGNAAVTEFAQSIPAHCAPGVAELALECATVWRQLAQALKERSDTA